MRHSGDLRKAAQLIYQNYAPDQSNCRAVDDNDDPYRLVLALATVESFSTTRLEHIIENSLTRSALALGRDGFDFSIGLGQIRRSTIEKILAKRDHRSIPVEFQPRQLTASILTPCWNLELVRLVVTDIMSKQQLPSTGLDRETVTYIAREYNGQTHSSPLSRAVSHAVYNEIVFNLFQLYRFKSLLP